MSSELMCKHGLWPHEECKDCRIVGPERKISNIDEIRKRHEGDLWIEGDTDGEDAHHDRGWLLEQLNALMFLMGEKDQRIAKLEEQIENMGHCSDCFRPFPACNCKAQMAE